MNALTSNLPLQDMIAGVIRTATEKLAADENPFAAKKSSTDKSGKTTNKTGKTHPTDKSAKTEKTAALTDPDYIEKLASAVEYINANLGDLMPQSQGVIQTALTKMAARADQVGAGRGASALQTNEGSPTKGKQKYTKDKPAGDDASESEAGTAMQAHGLPAGATQISNDMNKAPGQDSGSVPHATYPEKGPLTNIKKFASVRDYYAWAMSKKAEEKTAFAVTEEGHKFDAEKHRLLARQAAERAEHLEKYKALRAEGVPVKFTHALRFGYPEGTDARPDAAARHHEYAAKKHEEGRNAWNPLGGMLTPSEHEKGGLPGLFGGYGASKPKSYKIPKDTGSEKTAQQLILQKLAGEDVMKANIDGGGTSNPLAGMGQLTTTHAGQASPHQAGDPTGGFGNEARKHIGSNMAAINYTKRDAKGPVKKQLKEVLDEPALSAKHDSKLQENLRSTGQAGVKIAAARAFLQKIAEEGCTCNDSGECKCCKMKTAMKSKLAAGPVTDPQQMMQQNSGAVQSSPNLPGQGQTAQGEAGEGADGCTCGNAGECRVCKLKAALAAARAESQKGGAGGSAEPAPVPGSKDL